MNRLSSKRLGREFKDIIGTTSHARRWSMGRRQRRALAAPAPTREEVLAPYKQANWRGLAIAGVVIISLGLLYIAYITFFG